MSKASAPDQPSVQDGLPMPRRAWAVAAISFGMALFVMDGNIANVALPTIARELKVSEGAVTNVVTIYQLVMVMVLLPFAALGDRLGHRRLYQSGLVLFFATSAFCLFVDNFVELLVLRAGQALGAGMALSVTAAMLREIYPAHRLGSGLGFNSVIVASAAAVSPTLGGFVVAHLAWQYVFVLAAPLALLSLLLGRVLPEPHVRSVANDYAGGVWSALTVALLIIGLQLSTHSSSIAAGIAMALAGVISAVLLVRRERRRERPILPVDLLAKPVFGLSLLAAIAVFCAIGAVMIALPFRFEQTLGYAPDEVGLLLLPF
ncbi:MAG: MFS transporter, partial [Novosphingobium sp.]|nr:MFS transporter [Novosphingobium sp.]